MTYQVKQTIIAAFVAAVSLSAVPAFAENFQVAVNGSVTDTTCSAVVSKNNIAMGVINKSSFPSVGSVVEGPAFDVNVSNCPAVMSRVVITFKGTADQNDNQSFALNPTPTAAKGVAVQVKSAGSPYVIAPNGNYERTLSNGQAQASFIVGYVATKPKNEIQAGSSDSSFNIEVTYQ